MYNDSNISFQIYSKNCIVQLNEHCFTKNGQTPLDVCAILDCVLDNTFTELEIRVPYHIIKSFSALLSVIAHRSPQIEEAWNHILHHQRINPQLEQPAVENSLKQPNSKLKSLTSLALSSHHTDEVGVPIGDEDQPYVPILGIIAKRCPVLINLSVRGLRLCIKRDLLELLLGDYMIDQLSPLTTLYGATMGSLRAYGFQKSSWLRSAQPFRRSNSSVSVPHLIASATVMSDYHICSSVCSGSSTRSCRLSSVANLALHLR